MCTFIKPGLKLPVLQISRLLTQHMPVSYENMHPCTTSRLHGAMQTPAILHCLGTLLLDKTYTHSITLWLQDSPQGLTKISFRHLNILAAKKMLGGLVKLGPPNKTILKIKLLATVGSLPTYLWLWSKAFWTRLRPGLRQAQTRLQAWTSLTAGSNQAPGSDQAQTGLSLRPD